MDSPYFGSHWNQQSRPRYSPSFRGVPVQRMATPTSSTKVVSIPVHFVGAETTRSASALKIQNVFRGFLVRKSVKRITVIRREVDEIERMISQSGTVELIRRDAKERLRVNETLMALLFKLDSVRGVDSGVRDCRKAVIKKAIALQERVDAIVAGDQTLGNDHVVEVDDSDALAEAVDQTLETKDSDECLAAVDQSLEIEGTSSVINAVDQTLEIEGEAQCVKGPTNVLIDGNCSEKAVVETLELHCPGARGPNMGESDTMPESKDVPKSQFSYDIVEPSAENGEKMDVTDVGVDSVVKANEEEACVVKQIVENHNTTPSVSECVEESVETSPTENQSDLRSFIEGAEENTSWKQEDRMEMPQAERTEGNLKDCLGAGGRDDNKGNRELLERMMEDNRKMMSLMTQLFEKNEVQTRMLSSLTQRVEQLERAFVCDRLRRKKKRHAA